jgi:hypothetical protein
MNQKFTKALYILLCHLLEAPIPTCPGCEWAQQTTVALPRTLLTSYSAQEVVQLSILRFDLLQKSK